MSTFNLAFKFSVHTHTHKMGEKEVPKNGDRENAAAHWPRQPNPPALPSPPPQHIMRRQYATKAELYAGAAEYFARLAGLKLLTGLPPPVPSRRGSHTENGIHVFLHSILAMLGVLLGIDFHVKEFLQLDNVFPFLIAII